jgi:hypothetical protein
MQWYLLKCLSFRATLPGNFFARVLSYFFYPISQHFLAVLISHQLIFIRFFYAEERAFFLMPAVDC